MISKQIKAETIERRAAELIARHGTGDPFRIARGEGYRVYHKYLGGIKGFYCRILGKDVICLNNSLGEPLCSEVAAHELGHAVLHSPCGLLTVPDAVLWRESDVEYEANAFASHLIVPTAGLTERLAECGEYGDSPAALAAYFGCDVNLILIKIRELQRLGMRFNLPFDPDALYMKNLSAEAARHC
ncbi:MAG: ImmA/IrrE family metallo-endopeptidase [Clostridia bacterium]|nr:ImmA/IrrE family metallo-endopeptidase [Clostridia bacterium]